MQQNVNLNCLIEFQIIAILSTLFFGTLSSFVDKTYEKIIGNHDKEFLSNKHETVLVALRLQIPDPCRSLLKSEK